VASNECPCGRARAGCEYHDPALQWDLGAAETVQVPVSGPTAIHGGRQVVDLQDGGYLAPSRTINHNTTVADGYQELLVRKYRQAYTDGWAFHQDPPGVWTLADVPAGYDRTAIGLPVATQSP
jgi:hypothetical protein